MIEIKTGQEIWDIIQHPDIAYLEAEIDKEKSYHFELLGGVNKNGIVNARYYPVMTPEQVAEMEKQEQLRQICEELDEAVMFNDTAEIARCQQAYADLNNGITIKTKAEVEAELAIARTESDELLIAYLTAKGVIE